jgi:hypothetical protein
MTIETAAAWATSASPFLQSVFVFLIPVLVITSVLLGRSLLHRDASPARARLAMGVIAAGSMLTILYGVTLGLVGMLAISRFGASFSNYTTFGYFASMFGTLYILYDSTVAEYRSGRQSA